MTERAKKIYDAWNDVYNLQRECYAHHIPSALAAAIRETINQLQQGTSVGAVIMCADVLELCEELENL
jgi:hypothetical protein